MGIRSYLSNLFSSSSTPLGVSLKTHTVYPEIMIAEDNSFVAVMYKQDGEVVERFIGAASTRQEAKKAAKKALAKTAKNYLIGA